MQQHNPPHPGELIYQTYIEPFEQMTRNMIADRLGVSHSAFNRLLNGVSALSPEMAIKLSKVLGRSAESWLALQKNYELWHASKSVDTKGLKPIDFSRVA